MKSEDIKFYRSKVVTDTDENGGAIDLAKEVISGVKFNLFPRVTSFERTSGKVRYRKAFIANRAQAAEPAFDACIALTVPSEGGDRFYIKKAEKNDVQEEIIDSQWTGGGKLYADITAGQSSLQILFPFNDYQINQGDMLLVKSDTGAMFTAKVESASWSGNVAMISIDSQAPDNFSSSNTYGGICIELGDLEAKAENFSVVSSSGIFAGEEGVSVTNKGTVDDDWTITFVSPTSFNVSGALTGALPSGTISAHYQPMNSAGGSFYFVLGQLIWNGTWKAGDRFTFSTKSASNGFWLKEVIPAGTERSPDNFIRLDWITD